ncbi:MAG: hypothetical protein ACOYLK_14690 [Sphingomonas sp.]
MASYLPLPAYQVPRNALLDVSGISDAIDTGIKVKQQGVENQFRNEQLDMQRQQFSATQADRADAKLEKFKTAAAGIAQTIMDDPDQARAATQWQRLVSSDPRWKTALSQYGVDPNDHRGGAKLIIAQARGYQDPLERQKSQAQVDLYRAQAAKALRDASGQAAEYGKSGSVFQGQDGKFYTIQFGSNGQRKIEPVEAGGAALAPAKGVTQIGDELVSNATGAPVRNVAPQIQGGEAAKVVGRDAGELETTFPKASATLRAVSQGQRIVLNTVDQTLGRINGYTAGMLGTALGMLPGTEATDVAKDIQTIKANIGFDKLQDMRANSPTGGALGAIAVQELQALQSVFGNLEQAQTAGQLRQRLVELRSTLQTFQRLREQAYAEQYATQLQKRGQEAPRMEFKNLPPGLSLQRID